MEISIGFLSVFVRGFVEPALQFDAKPGNQTTAYFFTVADFIIYMPLGSSGDAETLPL